MKDDEPTPAVAENETVVIEHPVDQPQVVHVHHQREVICKAGTKELTFGPVVHQHPNIGGHESCRYVRTDDVDELGRAIFRQAEAS